VSTQNNISPFVVGISGHRDLHPAVLQQLRASVTGILEQLARRLPDSELRIMAGMASGADLLVVQSAIELGLRVDALLPMPLADYARDFEPQSLALLKTLLAHPSVACRELPLSDADRAAGIAAGSAGRDALYGRVSRSLIRGCSLLIALWDGEPSLLPNGTADTVLRYLGVRTDRNKDDDRLQFSDSSPDPDIAARLVYWIPTARTRAAPAAETRSPCFLTGLGDNALLRLPTRPRRLEVHLRSLNIYNREYLRLVSSRWPAPPPPDSLLRSLPAQLRADPADEGVLERIDLQYGKADALALHFQRRSDRLFAFFNLVAFAMGLAYLVYEKFMNTRVLLFAYLLILTSSAVVYYVLHERHWFAKHLMCRALAETLRVKFYLRLAHGDQLVDAEEVLSLSGINSFHGFGWMGHVLTAVEAPPTYSEQEPGADVAGIDESWIENQRQYFTRKVAKLHRSSVRTKWMKRTLFGVIIVVVFVLLLLGGESGAGFTPGGSLENVLTFMMGLVAVTLASWELHQNKMASRELLWQYRNQLKHFSRARLQLSRTVAFGRRLEILAELGKDSLMESYLWTIHRFHREHEPPGRA